MKQYDIKVCSVCENVISVSALSKREAIRKIKELIKCSKIQNTFINNFSKRYVNLKIL